MSETSTKRRYADALADALAFRELFLESCCERWGFAGKRTAVAPE